MNREGGYALKLTVQLCGVVESQFHCVCNFRKVFICSDDDDDDPASNVSIGKLASARNAVV
jgi:hypothetical protein